MSDVIGNRVWNSDDAIFNERASLRSRHVYRIPDRIEHLEGVKEF